MAAPEAVEQGAAEPLLQRLDLVADRRLRHVQRVGRAREAQVARRRLEDHQRVQRR